MPADKPFTELLTDADSRLLSVFEDSRAEFVPVPTRVLRILLAGYRRARVLEERVREIEAERAALLDLKLPSPKARTVRALRAALGERWATAREIADAADFRLNTTLVYLCRMKKEGLVEHRARNVKHVPTEYRLVSSERERTGEP